MEPVQKSSTLEDQTILITGATNGIGLATARELARMSAQVVIIGRNASRTDSAVRSIRHTTGNPRVAGLVGDLSVQAEVRRLADEFRQRYDRLNVLINNAGAVFYHHRLSPDGYDMTLALNHLSYFMLTNLLLDLIKESAPARIVNVSSTAHWVARVNPDDLTKSLNFGGWWAYSQTKLMNILFTYELARRLDGTVTANCLHPGVVATNLGRSTDGIFRRMWNLWERLGPGPEQGAQTSIYLASSPDVSGVTGKYFVNCKPVRSSSETYNEDTARRLWDASRELTGVG